MEIKEHKKSFQLERIILFSDAVFAIAITLLVIELKLPEMKEVSNKFLAEGLVHIIPHFFSFFLSFMIIGIYWLAHHRMFNYVINYDSTLIWLNLFFLFFIALMPFSSNIYGVYSVLNTAYILYVFNITMLALFLILMYNQISKPGKNLSSGLENRGLVRYYIARAAVVPFCFLIGLIITLVFETGWSIAVSRMSPILIFPAMRILKRKFSDVI
ncbi:MAG: TMEM175 family protein [bacterium]